MRWLAALVALLTGCERAPETIRIASFNTHLARGAPGALIAELERGSPQIEAVVATLRAARPDIVLLNEIDHDGEGRALALLAESLAEAGLEYGYRFTAPVNTGVRTGLDLDGDGSTGGPADRQGWGLFEGQFGMALLSRFPIDEAGIRTYRLTKWTDRPGHGFPHERYAPEARARLRLSSKSHWDVPVEVAGETLHLLASHPTPPALDDPPGPNRARNADEIGFWTDYLGGEVWMRPDGGGAPGLKPGTPFVVLGDLNNDPEPGEGDKEAIRALLAHPRLHDPLPKGSLGTATADWPETGPLRVDYVLPSAGLEVTGSAVADPLSRPDDEGEAVPASDHRLVWVDIALPLERSRTP